MQKKSKKSTPTESFSNNNNIYDSKHYPSFLYQNPSFSMNSFQQQSFIDRDSTLRVKRCHKNNQPSGKELHNSQLSQEDEEINKKKENLNKRLQFCFDNCKMIGRTNSSYVYSLFDKEKNSMKRALKLQLHPKQLKLCSSGQNSQSGQNQNIQSGQNNLSQQMSCNQNNNQTMLQTYNQNISQNSNSNNNSSCSCQMVKQEWNILKDMQHPHVVSVYNFYENLEIEPNSYCCAIEMELAECNLHQLILKVQEQKQFSLQFVKRLLHEVSTALHYFHNTVNCTHNDIKPDNIFLFFDNSSSQYYAKIADLGTARQYTPDSHTSDSLFDNWKSRNPDYQSPEIIQFLNEAKNRELNQISSIPSFDEKKADIFNLGNLFFAVLFQLRPFSCRGATQTDPLYKLIFEGRLEEFWSQDRFQKMLNYWASYQKQSDMVHMIQLITCMIYHDPSQRPSIEQVLSHPWFANQNQQEQEQSQTTPLQ